MSKHGPNVWVVRVGAKYTMKVEGVRGRLLVPGSQRKAIHIARQIAAANRSELVIQGKTGRIRAKDSHGHDAFPPRG